MAVKIDLANNTVSLGVGDLVAEPLAGAGRVAGLSVWTRMALGREAHAQHQRTQAGLHEGYGREIFVRYATTVDEFVVTIQGRIDGVHPPANGDPCIVEEIKSVVMPPLMFAALESSAYPHYVEQLRLYCFFLEQQQHKASGRLVFINVADGARKEIAVAGPFDDCEKLIAERVRALIGQARQQQRRQARRRSLAPALQFPHDRPRKYQDEMIAAVARAVASGRHLLVSAPSGIGKTAAALFPVLQHALAHDMRVFFVTAKNTQQQIVMDTLSRMARRDESARFGERSLAKTGATAATAVFFRAREQMCINTVYACREEFCPHLQMIAPKLERTGVIERLLEQGLIAPEAMMEAGRAASLCPFELALLEAELTDVIVCDYNYVFDPQVYFRRFFQDADYSDAILVIDEAHNLVQRAMDYYSPELRRRQIHDLASHLKHLEPALARDFRKFLGLVDELFESFAGQRGDEYSQLEEAGAPGAEKILIESPRAYFEDLKPAFNKLAMRYLLDKITSGRAIPDDPVEQFFSDFGQFCAVLAMEGEEFSYIFDAGNGQALRILCKDPSRQLARRLEGFHSVVAMSATLLPMEFYRQMLGFESGRTDVAVYPSPFPRENRKIFVVPSVSTTYRRRAAHYGQIAELIAATAGAHRGNYMALFPSYEFLQAVAAKLPAGEWRLKLQQSKMTEAHRRDLLDCLRDVTAPKLVLAVQGGLFAEGVDYPGQALSGVIVVSPALPQVSFERELMRRYYEQRYGKGFEFAYLYPGMNRVIQSVGRLIRSETDCGVVVLVCQRFAQPQYSTLFPPDWSESDIEQAGLSDLGWKLSQFWAKIEQVRVCQIRALQRSKNQYNARSTRK
jgi:DNA excision repair protein ERCC-2